MEGVTWVEVLARGHEVHWRSRCVGDVIRIGRGYDNDVVLDDPHVAPRHLRLSRGADGRWLAEDLDSVNGIFVRGQAQPQRMLLVDGDRPLRIGNTWLRLRGAEQAVAPERPLPRRGAWTLALGLGGLTLGWFMLTTWLEQTGEPRPGPYVFSALFLLVIVLVWSASWAVLSRIFSGATRFSLHLGIACFAVLVYSLGSKLGSLAAYSLSWSRLPGSGYVGIWVVLALTCIAHLRAISLHRPALKAGAALALAAAGIAAQAVSHSEARRIAGPNVVSDTVAPPLLRLAAPHGYDAFFAADSALRPALDKARGEEPGQDGGDDDEDE